MIACTTLGALLAVSALAAPGIAEEVAQGAAETAAHEAVLRHLVSEKCQQALCLLGVEREQLSDDLMARLKDYGKIATPQVDDFEIENGVARGFLKRRALMIDISETQLVNDAGDQLAVVDVDFYRGVLDARACRYRLKWDGAKWTQSESPSCTF